MITHLRILVLFFVSIAGLASCKAIKAITNEMTLDFKDSITFLASPDLTIVITKIWKI